MAAPAWAAHLVVLQRVVRPLIGAQQQLTDPGFTAGRPGPAPQRNVGCSAVTVQLCAKWVCGCLV
jgi:hypothetical protein